MSEEDDTLLSTTLTQGMEVPMKAVLKFQQPVSQARHLLTWGSSFLVHMVQLRQLAKDILDAQRMQYLAFNSKPTSKDLLQSHSVTMKGKTWSVKFQQRWLDQFPYLSYTFILAGGICRNCIIFLEQPHGRQ